VAYLKSEMEKIEILGDDGSRRSAEVKGEGVFYGA